MTPARDSLLAAAYRLAAQHTLDEVRPEMIAAAAGLSLAQFHEHFETVNDCLLAMQQEFMTRLREGVLGAALAAPAGFARIKTGSLIYLDACLEDRPLRSWLMQARAQTRVLADALRKQNQVYVVLLQPEFKQLGWPYAQDAARLYMAMLMEASIAEHAAGKAIAEFRDTLLDFLKTY